MASREEISTESTTGEMPWDDIWDFSLYKKTQVTMKTTIYEVKECQPETE